MPHRNHAGLSAVEAWLIGKEYVAVAGYVLYSASTSFFIPFLITFLLYARIFMVLRRRLAAVRMRRQPLPPQTTTGTGSSIWTWRLRRRKRDSDPKQRTDVDSTFVADLSEEKSSLEVRTVLGRGSRSDRPRPRYHANARCTPRHAARVDALACS